MITLPQRALPPRVNTLARANYRRSLNSSAGLSIHRVAHVRQNPRHDVSKPLHVSLLSDASQHHQKGAQGHGNLTQPRGFFEAPLGKSTQGDGYGSR